MTIGYARSLIAIVGLASVVSVVVSGCGPDTDGAPSTTISVPSSAAEAARVTTTSLTTTPTTTILLTTTAPVTTTTRAPTTTTTTTTVPWPIPEEQATRVEELIAATEAFRGRAFLRRPDVETITIGELADRFPDTSGEHYRETKGWQKAFLELLGMATPDTDIVMVLAALEAPGPEPFYDFNRARIVIPTGGTPLDEYQSWVLMGELVHALTHQHNPLLVGNLSGDGEDPDRLAARLALLEGEAVLIQSLYLDSLPPEQRAKVAEQAGERPASPVDQAPSMLRDIALFPSRAGSFFAVELYRLGGMAALDQALDRPPETTEQVLHMERYRGLEPAVEVDPFTVAADRYVLVEQGTWGERRWRALLGHHSGSVEAARAAEGWGGDHYQILWEPETAGVVFLIRYAADSFADESEMNAAIRDLITSGMKVGSSRVVDTVTEWVEGVDYAMLAWDVDAITFLAASDPEVGRRIVSELEVDV